MNPIRKDNPDEESKNIELVIRLPEEVYTHFLSRYKYQDTNDTGLSDSEKAGVAIKNGTLLPEYMEELKRKKLMEVDGGTDKERIKKTIEEAVIILENERPHCGGRITFTEEEKCEAFDMAIEALEHKIRAEIEEEREDR